MILGITAAQVAGLTYDETEKLNRLLITYGNHAYKNIQKRKYYEGNISLNDVNLGIALPEGMRGLEIGCAWGSKAVDVLAARSMFDGYVGASGNDIAELNQIVTDNNLIAQYQKTTKDELLYGSSFATLSRDEKIGCKIRYHSPQTAAALWDGEKNRIDCGFAIISTAPSNAAELSWLPSLINFYTDDAVIVLTRTDNNMWIAEHYPHRMGRPLIEPMTWNATSSKPFGRSRIKEPIRRLIDGYVRTMANATIGLEFATAPQKYILGLSDPQFDKIVNDKFKTYVGSIIAATVNPETGEKPTVGQLMQGNISPHVEMLRALATQFSAATGLPVTDTGVINDANPTSSDAIEAQTKTLVGLAEDLNTSNGDSLRTIALMALAIKNGVTLDDLTDEQKDVIAHFKNPAMPSIASTADAAIKIASARENFAATDVFAEMIGFDQADIRRIKAQEQLVRANALLVAAMNDEN